MVSIDLINEPAKFFAYQLISHIHLIRQMECQQIVRELTPPEKRRETLQYAAQELKNERGNLNTSIVMAPRALVASALPHLIENNERGLVVLTLETILDPKHYQRDDDIENPLKSIDHTLVVHAADYLMQKYEGLPLTTGAGDLQVMHRAYGFALEQIPPDGPAHSLQRASVQSKLQQLEPHVATDAEGVHHRAAAVHQLRLA